MAVCFFTNTAPVLTDLASFPRLETSNGGHNFGGWRPLLLKASEKNGLTRYNLLTALIVAVHDQDCELAIMDLLCSLTESLFLPLLPGPVEMRDYFAAWLGILLKENYIVRVEEMKGVEIVQSNLVPEHHTDQLSLCVLPLHLLYIFLVVDDEEQFIPGVLDWKMLLKVAKAHPGYYCYAIVSW